MKSNNKISYLLMILISGILWTYSAGCSSVTIIPDWNEIPNDKPILVKTKSGSEHRFDKIQFLRDSLLLGFANPVPKIIPVNNIATIASVNDENVKLLQTSFTVTGTICGIAAIYYVIQIFSGPIFPGLKQ